MDVDEHYVAVNEDVNKQVSFSKLQLVIGSRKKYEKEVKRQLAEAHPGDERAKRIHLRLALLRARILRRNLNAKCEDPGRTFLRQDIEGADCQVYFNDPEEADSHEGHENLFESEYEWLDEEQHSAAAKDVIISGPKTLVARNTDSDDSENESCSDSDD